MRRRLLLAVSIAALICSTARVIAQDRQHIAAAESSSTDATTHTSTSASSDTVHSNALDARSIRVEGEKRFHANCGRCHVAPHKFPPRAMATIIRHMRVRALITDEDMKYILSYMTQ